MDLKNIKKNHSIKVSYFLNAIFIRRMLSYHEYHESEYNVKRLIDYRYRI